MKAWNVHLRENESIKAKWLVLAHEELTFDALMDEISDTQTVNGLFYRVQRIYGDGNGYNHGILLPDKIRIVPMHMVELIEEADYIPEIQE